MARIVNVPYSKLAELALSMAEQASVKADEQTLALVQAVRTFLRGLVDGSLRVTAGEAGTDKVVEDDPDKEDPVPHPPGLVAGSGGVMPDRGATAIAPGTAANGADGIIPESVSGAPKL